MHGRCNFTLEKSCSWKRSKLLIKETVKNLTKKIEYSGRNLTCNIFFISIPIARDLLKKKFKFTLAGKIRKNNPECLGNSQFQKVVSVFVQQLDYQNNAMIASN